MNTKITVLLAALLSTSAMANDNDNNQSCHINLTQNVKVTPAFVQVLDGDKSLYKITDDSKLYAQGELIHLNSEQQAIVDEYRQLVQELAPKVAHIISEGLDIAKDAVGTVFTELFGDDAELKSKVEAIVKKFEQRIAPMMNEAKGEYFLSKELANQDTDELSKEIEHDVEELISESSGHLMVLIGKMLLKGEDGMKDLEQKMEAFGESMEFRGNDLEKDAEMLCDQMKQLDALETEMQSKIPEISHFDLLSTQSI